MESPKVYEGIAACTAALSKGGISKDRKNQQQNYSFRGIDDIYNALSSVLAENKLCIIPRVMSRDVTERQTQKGGVLFYVVVDVEFDIVSAVDGSRHVAKVCGEAMDSADKATNKAMSAAYKYMALQLFCIPTEGDNDADSTTHMQIAPSREVSLLLDGVEVATDIETLRNLYEQAKNLPVHERDMANSAIRVKKSKLEKEQK